MGLPPQRFDSVFLEVCSAMLNAFKCGVQFNHVTIMFVQSFQIFPDGEVMTTFLFGCQARSRFHKNFSISKGQRDP